MNITDISFRHFQSQLSSIGLISGFAFLSLSYLIKDWSWFSSLLQILASVGLTIWATLAIIEESIKRDKDLRWKTTKILTYQTVLEHIRGIFTDSDVCTLIVLENGKEFWDLFNEISVNENKNVASAMIKYAILIRHSYEKKDKSTFENNKEEYIKVFMEFNKKISQHFNLITFSLIPRIQMFSADDHVNKELLKIEIAYSRFKKIADLQEDKSKLPQKDKVFLASIILVLADFLERLGLLYDELHRELSQEQNQK